MELACSIQILHRIDTFQTFNVLYGCEPFLARISYLLSTFHIGAVIFKSCCETDPHQFRTIDDNVSLTIMARKTSNFITYHTENGLIVVASVLSPNYLCPISAQPSSWVTFVSVNNVKIGGILVDKVRQKTHFRSGCENAEWPQ